MSHNCNYWMMDNKGVETFHSRICFLYVSFEGHVSMRYRAVLEGGVTKDMALYYITFLKTFLTSLPFDGEVIKENGQEYIMWYLRKLHPHRKHNLLYLSAFRVPDEGYCALCRWYAKRNTFKTDDERFMGFWEVHRERTGHAPIYPGRAGEYGDGTSGDDPITLAEFAANLAVDQEYALHYFRKDAPATVAAAKALAAPTDSVTVVGDAQPELVGIGLDNLAPL